MLSRYTVNLNNLISCNASYFEDHDMLHMKSIYLKINQ